MSKIKKIMREAIDNLTYRRAYCQIICHCTFCSPNKGCNRRVRRRRNFQRSWKKFRKNKYK